MIIFLLLSRVPPISDEESLFFLQSQSENNFFKHLNLIREDKPVSNKLRTDSRTSLPASGSQAIMRVQDNNYLESTIENILDFQPKPYIPSNYRNRPALGGPLVQLQPVQNIFLEQRPSFYSQTPPFYQQPEDNFQQQKQDYQQQETKIFR